MNKTDVIDFFDGLASTWDENQQRKQDIIDFILDKSGVSSGKDILDVATGTGVLLDDYLSRGVASVTGIDISSEMIKIAQNKFPQVNLICGDAESYRFSQSFDTVMIYNAFPHFINHDSLFSNLTKALKSGGRLTVAHGMSEKELEKCHSGVAKKVSRALPDKIALADVMSVYLDVDIAISDEEMYMVSGIKK